MTIPKFETDPSVLRLYRAFAAFSLRKVLFQWNETKSDLMRKMAYFQLKLGGSISKSPSRCCHSFAASWLHHAKRAVGVSTAKKCDRLNDL